MGKTIMIVDDSATMLMSIAGILSKAGYDLAQAKSGEQALSALRDGGEKPAMVITDLNMGEMNGIELIRNIRKLAGFKFTPLLMLTTESEQERRLEAKAVGATGWIVKPVQSDSLLQVIQQLVPGG